LHNFNLADHYHLQRLKGFTPLTSLWKNRLPVGIIFS